MLEPTAQRPTLKSGNPLFPGWYADPEIHFFNGRYYIYPTTSSDFSDQAAFECWSSGDLTNWRNDGIILDLADVRWSTNYAAWAPSCAQSPRDGKFYFYFSAGNGAGIGVAVLQLPGVDDEWVICYHRRPLGDTNAHHRIVCLDRLEFRADGTIAPVTLTHDGVPAHSAM